MVGMSGMVGIRAGEETPSARSRPSRTSGTACGRVEKPKSVSPPITPAIDWLPPR